ncbi:ROK family protein [Actinocrispum sp. NPDC049592]|uniref:ROK family protein n=1 Tax=Actinocrispum sp. NPDC049592 TaxID=3154835 RepID=UPI003418BBE0
MPGRQSSSAATVLRAVLEHGPVARSTVARLSGMSAAAVTRQYAGLAGLGLVTETGRLARGGLGHPHIPVDIDVENHVVAGIHIAHAQCTVAVLDLRGRIRAQVSVPHVSTEPLALLHHVAQQLRAFLGSQVPLGLGVAIGGWVDPDEGVVVEHASLGWHDVPVGDLLARHTGLPVRVDSHTRALVRAEQLFGEVRSAESVVHLFVGNVVDAAIVTGGVTHRGPRSAAGDIAHLPFGDLACGRGHSGCFEVTVSDRAWGERAGTSIRDVLASGRAGDRAARALMAERARIVGQAAALLFDVINPEVLVVTELGVLTFPECLSALRSEVAERSTVCADPGRSVLASSFSGDTVLGVAAGAVQLDAIYSDPLAVPVFGLT